VYTAHHLYKLFEENHRSFWKGHDTTTFWPNRVKYILHSCAIWENGMISKFHCTSYESSNVIYLKTAQVWTVAACVALLTDLHVCKCVWIQALTEVLKHRLLLKVNFF
jgi:hypothetical protein